MTSPTIVEFSGNWDIEKNTEFTNGMYGTKITKNKQYQQLMVIRNHLLTSL